ncbi:Eukaryotic translation initiation factor 4 gamma 3, partial [Takifugu flavidus]
MARGMNEFPSLFVLNLGRRSLWLIRLLWLWMTVCRGWRTLSMMLRSLSIVLLSATVARAHHSVGQDAGGHRLVEHPEEFPADVEGSESPQEVHPALGLLVQLPRVACPVQPIVQPQPKIFVGCCCGTNTKDQHKESLDRLCKLLQTFGKDLDTGDTKPQMDRYFDHISHIVQERKASTRTCLMLQDVLDLRRVNVISDGRITSIWIGSECNYTQAWCKSVIHHMEQFDHIKKSPRKPTRRGRPNPHNYRRYRSVSPRRGGRFDWDNTSGRKCQAQLDSDYWCLSRELGEVTEETRRLQQEGHTRDLVTQPADKGETPQPKL